MAMEGPRPDCPACGERDFPYLEGRAGSRAARLCGRNAIQLLPRAQEPPPLAAIADRLGAEWDVTWNDHLLSARKGALGDGGIAVHLFRDGRAIVEGTTDEAEARSLYARVVGT